MQRARVGRRSKSREHNLGTDLHQAPLGDLSAAGPLQVNKAQKSALRLYLSATRFAHSLQQLGSILQREFEGTITEWE